MSQLIIVILSVLAYFGIGYVSVRIWTTMFPVQVCKLDNSLHEPGSTYSYISTGYLCTRSPLLFSQWNTYTDWPYAFWWWICGWPVMLSSLVITFITSKTNNVFYCLSEKARTSTTFRAPPPVPPIIKDSYQLAAENEVEEMLKTGTE